MTVMATGRSSRSGLTVTVFGATGNIGRHLLQRFGKLRISSKFVFKDYLSSQVVVGPSSWLPIDVTNILWGHCVYWVTLGRSIRS